MQINFQEELDSSKMTETTSVFAASVLAGVLTQEEKDRVVESLLEVGEYEMDFIWSYTLHLVDLLSAANESGEKKELGIDTLITYTLQHMGIDVNS